jgi:hypothetical protein
MGESIVTETTAWPSALPAWLQPIAHAPVDYGDGRRVVEGIVNDLCVLWVAGDLTICLDGVTTAERLREIADMMEAFAQ